MHHKSSPQGYQKSTLPIHVVVRMQAMVRGFLTRKRVHQIYGFQASEGLMFRGFDIDPEKLEEQRYRV